MQIQNIAIPLIAFGCIFVYVGNRFSFDCVRSVLIRTAIIFFSYLVVTLELLSLFRGITRTGLILVWSGPIIGFMFWLRNVHKRNQVVRLPTIRVPKTFGDRILLLGILGILIVTFIVAYIAPPQTWDSLTYHLSRIAHWAQNQSVRHYSTGIARQNSMSPGAEMINLVLYVLIGGDRLANFPQWFAMLLSLIGVSLIAKHLGATTTGQLLASFFAATLPLGIVESSSTINDYVITFWITCAAIECISFHRNSRHPALAFLSLSAGLAILTKPISIPYLIPFAIWIAVLILKRFSLSSLLSWGLFALFSIGLLNAGYLTRNISTYASISNPIDFKIHTNELLNVQGIFSIVLRNAGVQAGLSNPYINEFWSETIFKAHVKLGLDLHDPRTTSIGVFDVRPPTTREDSATNPYHAYLILVIFVLLLILRKKLGTLSLIYGLVCASTFILFSAIFKWQVFGNRFLLPFFILFASSAGFVLDQFNRIKLGHIVVIFLLIKSFPWLFSITSRPLISEPGVSFVESILEEPREKLYFANSLGIYEDFVQFSNGIKAKSCSTIGLILLGDDPEYLFWVLLGAPQNKLTIEWIVTDPYSPSTPGDFEPCAIICHGCPEEMQVIRGLEITLEAEGYSLFTEERN